MKRRSTVFACTAAALCIGTACRSPSDPGRYEIPARTGDGWETAALESVGMRRGPMEALLRLISHTDHHLIHGLLVVRRGKLVFEKYWTGTDLEPATLTPVERDFDHETLHYVASVSKSLTSALFGIALGMGRVGSVDDSMFSYFPTYSDLKTSENGYITLRHLLAFSSGLDWNEFVYGFDDSRDSHYQMFHSQDPVWYLLARPVTTVPGTTFHYNSGETNLVGEVVRTTTGVSDLTEFAEAHLFGPLGIDSYRWLLFGLAPAVTFASGGASLRPRDMAKFGQLYLDRGAWNGTQVVPAWWVAASTTTQTPLVGSYGTLYGYGYNWWLGRSTCRDGPADYFRAAGWGGQEIFVYPALEMVIVFTRGAYYDASPLDVNDLIERYIFNAII
jgi:CubicO group peptidase (beta-lactamase class C family)